MRGTANILLVGLAAIGERSPKVGLSNSETRTPLAMRSLTSKDPTREATQVVGVKTFLPSREVRRGLALGEGFPPPRGGQEGACFGVECGLTPKGC